jgi:hypothetical protein
VSYTDSPLPTTLRIAFGLLLAEAIGVLVTAGFVVQAIVTEYPADPWRRSTVSTVTVAVVIAGLLAGLGWQLLRRRAWARGPLVVLELLFLPAGYFLINSGVPWLGIPLVVAALSCIALLVAPASRAALGIR